MLGGLNISFFELYNYASLLEQEEIPNYEGVIPLTQSVDIIGHPYLSENADLSKLLPVMRDASSKKRGHRFSYANERSKSNIELQLEQDGQWRVFHLEDDKVLIDNIFHCLSYNVPRIHQPD